MLAAPQLLSQFIAVLVCVVAATFSGYYLRSWHRRTRGLAEPAGVGARLLEATVLLAPYLIGLLLMLAARLGFTTQSFSTRFIDTATELLTALLLVRSGVYLLGLVLGSQSWVHKWEARLTLIVWAMLAFQLVGWFDAIERTLDAIDLLPGKSQFSLWALLKGLVVVTGFVVITSIVARAIERRVMLLESVALSTRIGISKFTYFFLVGLGVLLGVNASGVDLTALTVLTGAVGLGLGFGLQAITSNFVSGFVLLMDKSIKPGDVISFTGQTGTSTENFGWVQELRGRYVVVRDRDGVETLVPNQHLITNPVINWSYSDRRVRLKIPVRISYRDDPELALRVLLDSTEGNPRVLHDPAPVSRLMQFSDNGMDLELRFWIADPQNGVNNVRSDVNRAIWRLFRQHGITIPMAQREIHVRGRDIPLD
jgi:small-conductance mechanosensitive channel